MCSRIRYRLWQTWKNLTAGLSDGDRKEIRQILSPAEYRLFLTMAPADQAHSFRVFRTLQSRDEDHPGLLTAALLHDVGKAGRSYPIWERTAAVLLERFLDSRGESREKPPSGPLGQTLTHSRRHPERGAELARTAGASPLTVRLIRAHEGPLEDYPGPADERMLLEKLIQADDQN